MTEKILLVPVTGSKSVSQEKIKMKNQTENFTRKNSCDRKNKAYDKKSIISVTEGIFPVKERIFLVTGNLFPVWTKSKFNKSKVKIQTEKFLF